MGFADPTLTLDQLSEAGVKRISVGGAMARYALAAFLRSAREMKDQGAFTYRARDGADCGNQGGVQVTCFQTSFRERAKHEPGILRFRIVASRLRNDVAVAHDGE